MSKSDNANVSLTSCWLYFVVSYLATNIHFFQKGLGFVLLFAEPEIDFAIVGRDDVSILLRGTSHDPSPLSNSSFHRDIPRVHAFARISGARQTTLV